MRWGRGGGGWGGGRVGRGEGRAGGGWGRGKAGRGGGGVDRQLSVLEVGGLQYRFEAMENMAHSSFMYHDPMAGVATVHISDPAVADLQVRLVAVKTPKNCAAIFKQSKRARNRGGVGLSYYPDRLHSLEELIS